jgi:hypothetical protein
MRPHGSIQAVRMCHGIHTDHILWCFDNPTGLRCENLLVNVVPELLSWLIV